MSEIIEYHRGVPVKKCNVLQLKAGASLYKRILDIMHDTGLSAHKILAYSSKPCEKCKNIEVIVFDKNDEPKKIKRGILFDNMPENNGINIIQQANAKKFKSDKKYQQTIE